MCTSYYFLPFQLLYSICLIPVMVSKLLFVASYLLKVQYHELSFKNLDGQCREIGFFFPIF
jgi:hypothetical protein